MTLALAAVPAGAGAWAAAGGGTGAARAGSVPAGPAPLAAGVVTSVTVSWASVDVPGVGFVVRRYPGGGGPAAAIGGTCAGIVTGTSCTDTGVPPGSWRYSTQPVLQAWSGSEGPLSPLVAITL